MKRHPLAIVAALAAVFGAADASAGIVVIDGRIQHAQVRNQFEGDVGLHAGLAARGQPSAMAVSATGHQGGAEERPEGEGYDGAPMPIGPNEVLQIQAGLISHEEALSGCGGASVATGPAGLFPLLVAAGALARWRRRR
mgnify:CR=1 FL=1